MSHAGHNTELDCSCKNCVLRYPKYFHMHQWDDLRKLVSVKEINGKKYYSNVDSQEQVCKKYNVFLPLWTSPRQRKIYSIMKWFYKLERGLKRFKVMINQQHLKNQSRRKSKKKSKPFDFSMFSMSDTDYSGITGNSTKNDLSFITGKNKKSNLGFITGGKKKNNLSYITGGKKKNNLSNILGSNKKKDYSSLLNNGSTNKKTKKKTKRNGKSNTTSIADINRKLGW